MAEPLLEVKGLTKTFALPKKHLFAGRSSFTVLKNIEFTLLKGETLCLVGESGSGKSTIGECIGGLQQVDEQKVFFKGKAIESYRKKKQDFQYFRRNVQYVFQNPHDSLNPRMTVRKILQEPMRIQQIYDSKTIEKEVILRLIHDVGLDEQLLDAYPGQLSGGQCQRIAIARALALKPELIICDEAVSALDVSVQATILTLLKELQQKYQTSYLFISHDLGVVRTIADRVIVLQQGEIVEQGPTNEIFTNTKHPYTKTLLQAGGLTHAALPR